ncbi:unnamed protein product [Sphenostylis stenocarpa]|uniref:Uncharacterized protein n=1 Tax=Sphenostylis stenocarpa TaxID=92480 RepID=A0AA86SDF3_9FABA|nr:unnamed protein product [Sphenostylis stenocarpa]
MVKKKKTNYILQSKVRPYQPTSSSKPKFPNKRKTKENRDADSPSSQQNVAAKTAAQRLARVMASQNAIADDGEDDLDFHHINLVNCSLDINIGLYIKSVGKWSKEITFPTTQKERRVRI